MEVEMNRTFFLSMLILVIGVIALYSTVTTLPKGDPADTSFRVGVIAPLSGNFATYGQQVQRGVELARRSLESIGIELEVEYEDACVATEGVPAANRLVHFKRISALVGSYCIASMVPNIDVFERQGILAFQASVVPQSLVNRQSIVSTFPSIKDEARIVADFAYARLGAKTAAILYLETPWGSEFREEFSRHFSASGGVVVSEEGSQIGVTDYRTELLKIKNDRPDILLFVHLGANMGNALKQARAIGLSQQVLGPDEAEQEEVLAVAGDAAEGLLLFVPEAAEETDVVKKFHQAYSEQYQAAPSLLSAHSFDATMITGRALKACKTDKRCVANYVRSVKDYSGATGMFSILEDGTTKREFVLKQVQNGRFVPLPTPAKSPAVKLRRDAL